MAGDVGEVAGSEAVYDAPLAGTALRVRDDRYEHDHGSGSAALDRAAEDVGLTDCVSRPARVERVRGPGEDAPLKIAGKGRGLATRHDALVPRPALLGTERKLRVGLP